MVSSLFDLDEKLPAFVLKKSGSFGSATGKNFLRSLNPRRNYKNFIWVNNPQYQFNLAALENYNRLFLADMPIVVSSCNTEMAHYFKKENFEIMKFGKEAVLNLSSNHFEKKSLKELVRTGMRNGNVEEIPYSYENKYALESFKSECVHGDEPQLKYFFNDQFLSSNRLFIMRSREGLWLGGLLITCADNENVKTDLILRRKNSPNGVMEAVIYHIFRKLKKEGYKNWSLGEVPYIVYDSPKISKEFLINFAGRRLKFAYNYLGLYNFKNKFNPDWKDVYLCCKPGISLFTIIKISWFSNLFKLILKKSFVPLSR